MPYKVNEARCHKTTKPRYQVTNWREYDKALQQRGSLTVWVTPEPWLLGMPPRPVGGGARVATRTSPLRPGTCCAWPSAALGGKTEGLLRSLTNLLGLELAVPDHTTFSRRSPGASTAHKARSCRDRFNRPEGVWSPGMAD